MEINYINLLIGFLSGFAVFYTIKKIFKLLLITVGLYSLSILVLELNGYISVNSQSLELIVIKIIHLFENFLTLAVNEPYIFLAFIVGSIIGYKVK